MSEEKSIKKLFVVADFIIVFSSLLFLTVTVFITKQNQASKFFYFNGTKVWQSPNLYIVSIICLLIFPIILFLQLKKNRKNMILCIGIAIIMVFSSIFIYLVFTGTGDREERYYYFTSPITGKDIIAEEWSWLLGGGVNFYETINDKHVHLIGNIPTDNGYRPLENNAYSLKWSENDFTIDFSFRDSGPNELWKTETLKLDTTKRKLCIVHP